MRLSLIKCGTYPNPQADQGEHHTRYSLLPHAEDWREADIPGLAYAYNCPLETATAAGSGALPGTFSAVSASQKNILVTTVKESCDGEDVILRAYESQGKRTEASIQLGFAAQSAAEVDLMEENVLQKISLQNGQFSAMFRPFEIKTFRLQVGEGENQ